MHKLSDSSVESKRNQDVLGVNSMALSLFRVSIIVAKFVCLEFFVPLENFSLILRSHHYRRRAVNFDLCSALMATEQ